MRFDHLFRRMGGAVLICFLAVSLGGVGLAQAQDIPTYRFGVINQRPVLATAAFWNPVLAWVSKRSGVNLELRMGLNADDTSERLLNGEYDFFYGMLAFMPKADFLGYQVLVRENDPPIMGAIIVRPDSPIQTVADLAGRDILFASRHVFYGYQLQMAFLHVEKINVQPRLMGNQESVMTAFRIGEGDAAAVNMRVLDRFLRRQSLNYRVVWQSELTPALPVTVQAHVPKGVAERVAQAFVDISREPDGQRVLAEVSQRVGTTLSGWVLSSDEEYQRVRQVYHLVANPAP